ncbi:hypothetical protein P8452_41874 [Trifolium repens]|nr:hypothetical protein P8452_41874 [Trifolium repens]
MFQNLHTTLHIKFESSSSNQSIVNVFPLSDEDETKEINHDGLKAFLGDEIEQEPNPNDTSDSTIDFVSNSIKDMVDDTTIIHPSNFLCPPPLSYFTFSHVSLGFGKHQEKQKRAKEERISGDDEKEDLVDVLLRIQESGSLEIPITTNNIEAVIFDAFAAGTDTTTSTIVWAISELMKNPSMKSQDLDMTEHYGLASGRKSYMCLIPTIYDV